ncbi:MAG: hypothetical protein KC621_34455 [Myxococcales bacterium]|nr:hypothetical protein [Myxococcales bacterium]
MDPGMRWAAVLAVLVGCAPEPTTSETGTEPEVRVDGMLTTTTWSTRSDQDGEVDVPIEVGDATTSLMVSLSTTQERPILLQLIDPSGEVVLDERDWRGDEKLTHAFDVLRKTNALNWPVRRTDEPLWAGTWHAIWASEHQEGGRNPDDGVDLVVMTKDDPDPAQATITVRLVWADGVELGVGHEAAVQAAVQTWQRDWAAYGLSVDATFHTSDMDPTLPFTANGDLAVEAIAAEVADPGDIVVFLGDSMVYKPGVFGTGPNTPGTPYPGEYHFVAVALDMFIDPSGAISTDLARLLSETLSHETAHFMGVPHVVESDWARYDALPDTPRCTTEATCESQAGRNLMFPFSQCKPSCPVRTLTPDQVGVLQHYVGAR